MVACDSGIAISWECATIPDMLPCRKKDSTLLGLTSQPTINVDVSSISISESHTGLVITAKAKKSVRTSSTSVEVSVVAGGDPSLTVEVVANNGAMVVVKHTSARGRRDIGEQKGSLGRRQAPEYMWSLGGAGYLGGSSAPKDEDVPGGFRGRDFILNMASSSMRDMLTPGGFYTISLLVNGSPGPSIQLKAPSKPTGGSCVTGPAVATEMVDTITCRCYGWSADDLPITYSVRVSGGSWSTPSFKQDMDLLLIAGVFEIAGRASDSEGGEAITEAQTITVVAASSASNATGNNSTTLAGGGVLDSLEGALGQMSGTGNAAGLLTATVMIAQGLDENAGASAAGGNSSASRRLLASSAAFRMRTRRMLLKSMSESSGSVQSSPRLAGSGLATVGALTRTPSEVGVSGGDQAVSILNASAGNIVPQEARSGGLASAFSTMSKLIELSKTGMPKETGFHVLLSAVRSTQTIATAYVSTMLPSQGGKCMATEGVSFTLRRMQTKEYGFDFSGFTCGGQNNSATPGELNAFVHDDNEAYGLGVVTIVIDTIWSPPIIADDGVFSTGAVGFAYGQSKQVKCAETAEGGCHRSSHKIDLGHATTAEYSAVSRREKGETIAESLRRSTMRRDVHNFQSQAAAKVIGIKCWIWQNTAWVHHEDVCKMASSRLNATTNVVTVDCACSNQGFYMVSFEPPAEVDLKIQIDAWSGRQALTGSISLAVCLSCFFSVCAILAGWHYTSILARRYNTFIGFEWSDFAWTRLYQDPSKVQNLKTLDPKL